MEFEVIRVSLRWVRFEGVGFGVGVGFKGEISLG